MTIRTVTVSGVTAVNFNPDGNNPLFYTDERFCWVRNLSEAIMYASLDSGCVAGAAGTITIPAGEAGMLELTPDNAVYINGTGSAEVRTQDFPECPFKKQAKGGGESVLIEKSVTANGVYSAADDSADGYSRVTVNVPDRVKDKKETVLFLNYTFSVPSSLVLMDDMTNYDEIWLVGYAGGGLFVSMYPVEALALNKRVKVSTDGNYAWFTISNMHTLTFFMGNMVVYKIIGWKWK